MHLADTPPGQTPSCQVHAGIHTTPCPVHAGIHSLVAARIVQLHEVFSPTSLCFHDVDIGSDNPSEQKYVCKNLDKKVSTAMLAIKRSAGATPEMNLRKLSHSGDKACMWEIQSDLESQERCQNKSKTGGYQGIKWPHKND